MGSLKKKLSRVKRTVLAKTGRRSVIRPAETSGVSGAGKSSVVYLGNGASENGYAAYFADNNINGRVYSGLGGVCNECAVQHVDGGSFDEVTIRNAFAHEEADAKFAGFVLRKKHADGSWLWYMEDGSWQPLSAGEFRPKRFLDGDRLPAADSAAAPQVYMLEAHWVSEDGKSLDCGYRMFRHRITAHALGSYKGRGYLNSREGFLYNLNEKGQKFFETDITLTEDDRLMVIHGFRKWDYERYGLKYGPEYEHMTYAKTKALDIYGEHPMDVREFYELIKAQTEDIAFEVDIQDVKPDLAKRKIQHLVADCRGDREVLKRMLLQVYNRKVYRTIDSIYHFEAYMYNVRRHIEKLDEIITFCLDNGICSLSLRASEATPEIIQKIKNAGFYVLAYTIKRDLTFANTVLDFGADTICSDSITEEELDGCSTRLGRYPYQLMCVWEMSGNSGGHDEKDAGGGQNALEKKLPGEIENNGTFAAPDWPFDAPADGFEGWTACVVRDTDKKFWYCGDGLYRTENQKGPKEAGKQSKVFRPGEKLPEFLVREDDTVYLHASFVE